MSEDASFDPYTLTAAVAAAIASSLLGAFKVYQYNRRRGVDEEKGYTPQDRKRFDRTERRVKELCKNLESMLRHFEIDIYSISS